MNDFEKTIKAYLDERARSDKEFADKYNNADKSIEQCCDFICGEVRKSKRMGFSDDEVFGMAVHYYCEDDLKIEGSQKDCEVVVNRTIELEESEKARLRELAKAEFLNAEQRRLENERKQEEEKRRKAEEKKAKALEKKREEEDKSDLLFSF